MNPVPILLLYHWQCQVPPVGTIAMIISSASTVRQSSAFADWVLMVAPPLIFFLVAVILWGSPQLWRNYAAGGQGWY